MYKITSTNNIKSFTKIKDLNIARTISNNEITAILMKTLCKLFKKEDFL